MTNIGLSDESGLVYVGTTSNYGQVMSPQPTLFAAQFVNRDFEASDLGNAHFENPKIVFLDEAYDPVSRVRKGKLYKSDGRQPQEWHILPPSSPYTREERMLTWGQFNLRAELESFDTVDPVLVLGSGDDKTFWDLVSVEAAIGQVAVIYLRARQSFGLLPEIDYRAVPGEFVDELKVRMDALLKDIRAASDESVVDSCREAMTCLLSARIAQRDGKTIRKDLGDLIAAYEKGIKPDSIVRLGRVVARLHSRRKHAESDRGLRALDTQDAELAVHAVTFVLKEFKWVK